MAHLQREPVDGMRRIDSLLQMGMTRVLHPESLDLARLAELLREGCGPTLMGEVVGRTRLRDELVRHLDCSQLEAETLVDTMIGRGFIRRGVDRVGLIEWVIAPASQG